MLSPLHPIQIEILAQALAADGVSPHEARLAAVAQLAGRRGANPVLVSVALDPSEPEIARLRAFGRLAAMLARPFVRRPAAA